MRVLVIDDDAICRITAKSIIERMQIAVDVAESYNEALQKLLSQSYRAILLDIVMPHISGVDIAKNIRDGKAGEANRKIAIIAMSGNSSNNDRSYYRQSGFDGCLDKPFDRNSLKAILDELLV